nr:uncharacterized protein LOC109737491 isoform X4 [Aegilops tauschii subsp. strangulata]
MQPPSPRSRSTGPPPTLPAIPNPTTETAAPAPAFFLAPDAAARLLSGECRGATAVEAAVGWSPASSPLRSPWRSAASNLLDGARNPRRPISSSHGHGHGEPTSCAAAGALLLRTVCVSGTAMLLEATSVTAAMYGGDHKLSDDRLPLLPLVLFSTPIALLCLFRALATGLVKAY